MKYTLSIDTTDADDRGLALAVKVTASPNVQTFLVNRLLEIVGGSATGYVSNVADRVEAAITADPTKLDAVVQAAGLDLDSDPGEDVPGPSPVVIVTP